MNSSAKVIPLLCVFSQIPLQDKGAIASASLSLCIYASETIRAFLQVKGGNADLISSILCLLLFEGTEHDICFICINPHFKFSA